MNYTREDFKMYCLRKLGHPVIKINVSDDQIEDRIDEALSYFSEFHFDGTQTVYLKHKLTQEDCDRGWIQLPDNIIGVAKLLDTLTAPVTALDGLFSIEHQMILNGFNDYVTGSMTSYYLLRLSRETARELFYAAPLLRFNRHTNKLWIDAPRKHMIPDRWIIAECTAILDGDEYPDIWNNRWLQNYCAALIKEQWGNILTKYPNLQLVSGVQINADLILQGAKEDKQKLEEEMLSTYAPVTSIMFG